MSAGVAIDTSAAIAWLRRGGEEPHSLDSAGELFLPLPVVGELYFGTGVASRGEQSRALLERLIRDTTLLYPDLETARIYGRVRAGLRMMPAITPSKQNDLWIAALCIQHDLPLLTNDRGFGAVAGLAVLHW
jgi:tRNA(fMet)-specific endonuclease VapC